MIELIHPPVSERGHDMFTKKLHNAEKVKKGFIIYNFS